MTAPRFIRLKIGHGVAAEMYELAASRFIPSYMLQARQLALEVGTRERGNANAMTTREPSDIIYPSGLGVIYVFPMLSRDATAPIAGGYVAVTCNDITRPHASVRMAARFYRSPNDIRGLARK